MILNPRQDQRERPSMLGGLVYQECSTHIPVQTPKGVRPQLTQSIRPNYSVSRMHPQLTANNLAGATPKGTTILPFASPPPIFAVASPIPQYTTLSPYIVQAAAPAHPMLLTTTPISLPIQTFRQSYTNPFAVPTLPPPAPFNFSVPQMIQSPTAQFSAQPSVQQKNEERSEMKDEQKHGIGKGKFDVIESVYVDFSKLGPAHPSNLNEPKGSDETGSTTEVRSKSNLQTNVEQLLKQVNKLRSEISQDEETTNAREAELRLEISKEKAAALSTTEKIESLQQRLDILNEKAAEAKRDKLVERHFETSLMGFELERLHSVKNELLEAIKGLNGSVAALEDENDAIRAQTADLEKELKEINAKLIAKEASANTVDASAEQKVKELSSERERLLNELNRASKFNAQLLERLESAKADMAQADRLREQLARLEAEGSKYKQRLVAQEEEMRKPRASNAPSSAELERVNRLLAEKNEEVARFIRNEARLQSDIISLKTRISELEKSSNPYPTDAPSYRRPY